MSSYSFASFMKPYINKHFTVKNKAKPLILFEFLYNQPNSLFQSLLQ